MLTWHAGRLLTEAVVSKKLEDHNETGIKVRAANNSFADIIVLEDHNECSE